MKKVNRHRSTRHQNTNGIQAHTTAQLQHAANPWIIDGTIGNEIRDFCSSFFPFLNIGYEINIRIDEAFAIATALSMALRHTDGAGTVCE